jgi:hypothetical protein
MDNGMTNITKTHNLPKVLIFQVLLSKGKLNIANYDRRFNCLGQMPPPEMLISLRPSDPDKSVVYL